MQLLKWQISTRLNKDVYIVRMYIWTDHLGMCID